MRIETGKLLEGLKKLNVFVPTKSVITGWKCFLIKVFNSEEDQCVTFSLFREGINAEFTIKCLDADEMIGVYIIPASDLIGCVENCKHNNMVEITKTKKGLKVKHSTGFYELKGFSNLEIQKVEEFRLKIYEDFIQESDWIELDFGKLKSLLLNTKGAKIVGKSMYSDNSIFEYKDGQLSLYTTDGKKMNTGNLLCRGKRDFVFYVPNFILEDLSQVISEVGGRIRCYKNNLILFEMGIENITLITRLVNSGSVGLSAVKEVISKTKNVGMNVFKVKTEDLRRSLKRSFDFISKDVMGIKMEGMDGNVLLSGSLSGFGSFSENLEVKEYRGVKFETLVSPVSLYKSLVNEELTTVRVIEGYPIILKYENIENYIMPLLEG